MNNFITNNADIFFFITSIAVVVLIIILLIFAYMIYKLMRFVHHFIDKAEKSMDRVKESKVSDMIKNTLPIALPIIGFIFNNFKKRGKM